MKLTDKHYEHFKPIERIALFWDAMGRRDFPEADRLIATCPEKTYRMGDAAYTEGVRAIHDCCLHALLLIEQAAGSAVKFLAVALAMAVSEPTESEKFSKATHAYQLARKQALAYWEAWREFCADVGVDPEAVIRASWGSVPGFIADPLWSDLGADVDVDADAKAVALGLFRSRWTLIGRRHPSVSDG